jgi:hypothetical protein
MSLFDRFWKTTKSFWPSGLSEEQGRVLAQLNPSKIYVENVRSILGVSHAEALQILETAVRQGVFEKYVEVMCPDGTVATSARSDSELPSSVHCWIEDEDGILEETTLPTKNLRKAVFYRLDERSATFPHARTA